MPRLSKFYHFWTKTNIQFQGKKDWHYFTPIYGTTTTAATTSATSTTTVAESNQNALSAHQSPGHIFFVLEMEIFPPLMF